MKTEFGLALAIALSPMLSGAAMTASAAEIKVLSANGAKLILTALVPEFERTTNNKVTIDYGEARIVRNRILDGEAFDVTFRPAGWEELREKIVGDPVGIGHTDLGMAVLANTPKPDTTSSLRKQGQILT